MATTGERIKQARLALGMTQTELADKVGVKFSAIHKYESGLVVNLKRDTIEALARALDVKPSYLMCMDDDPSSEEATADISDYRTGEEKLLVRCWRMANEEERENVAYILRNHGMVYSSKWKNKKEV